MIYSYYIKLYLFLLEHRFFCTVALYFAFYVFFVNSLENVALCADSDPCEEAYKESLKDAQQQKVSDSWGKRVINGVALDGKSGKLGCASVERNGMVYVNQTFEMTDKDGNTIRRISDCMSAKKSK
jgi:hypothetical protein